MVKSRKGSVIYVNYSPYENSGKLQDFLLENFSNVFAFSIGHHNLGKAQYTNKLSIFKDSKFKRDFHLYFLPVSNVTVFLCLPPLIIACLVLKFALYLP